MYDLAIYTDSVSYAAVTAWATATIKQCGNLIRATNPAAGSERVFLCIHSSGATSQTAGVEPTWGTTRGALTLDNTNLTWQECTGIAGVNGDISTNLPTWAQVKAQSSSITLGQVCQSGDGTKILIACTAGTAGGSEPGSWAAFTTTGANTTDNTVTWVTVGTISGGVSSFAIWGAPHNRIAPALAAGWMQVNDIMYVASSHSESQGASLVWTLVSTSVLHPISIVCTTKTAAPPASAATGASISVTGSGWGDYGVGGCGAYIYGLTISVGTAATAQNINFAFNISTMLMHYEQCTFKLNSTGVSYFTLLSSGGGSANYRWTDCSWILGSNKQSGFLTVNLIGNIFTMVGGSISSSATAALTLGVFGASGTGFLPPSPMTVRAVNFTGIPSGSYLVNSGATLAGPIYFYDCGIPAGVNIVNTYGSPAPCAEVYVLRSDTTLTSYRHEKYDPRGSQVMETQLVRTGGGNDSVTPLAWKIVTASSSFVVLNAFGFCCMPIPTWNSATGQDITMTVYGIWQGAAVPFNSDIDIEVEYMGSTSSPLCTLITSNRASILATKTALTADTGSAWGQTGTNQVSAYQTAHAYGAYTGYILAGNAVPQQVWFMSTHSGSGTSGSDTTIFNSQADGAQVTDNSGANQIVWQAFTRFQIQVTLTGPQAQLVGAIYTRIRAWLASSTFWVDAIPVKSPAN
jgi:hypothetical protein